MRNRRILPAMVASTVWPFGKWTRKVVLGSTASTMPSSSIASSLAIGTPFANGVPMAKEEAIELDGIVEAVLPNTTFRVHLPNGHTVLATIAGKMRRFRLPAPAGGPGALARSPPDLTRRRTTFPPQGTLRR